MALTSKFIADFTSFYDAVQKASVMVKDLSKDADKASADFNKMVNSLSGEKVRQQATVMARAVEEVGGASKLTDTELRRVNATVTEAAAKMQKLGIAVPQSFKDIQKAAEGLDKPTQGWGSTLTNLTNIVRGFMALQIVGWFKDAAAAGFAWAGSMTKMHAQTELAYRDLQILEDVAIDTGTSMEALAKGVQIMQKSIGDRSARAGIEALGLSFDAILKMKPADQFAAIATAIGKIEDPNLRATAAAKIFGNSYREMMPALRSNIGEIAKSTKIVSDTQIEAADRAADRWEKFWKDQKKGWAAWAGSLVEGVEQGMSAWDKAQQRAEALRRGGTKALLELDAKAAAAAPKPLPILGGSSYPNQMGFLPSVREGTGAVRQLNQSIADHSAALAKAAAEQAKFAAAVDKGLERVRVQHFQLSQSAVTASQNVGGFQVQMSEFVTVSRDYSKTLMDAQIKTDAFGHVIPVSVLPNLERMGQGVIDLSEDVQSFGQLTSNYFKSGFGRDIAAAIQGGGNPVKAALTGFGQSLFGENSGLTKSITGGIEKVFGSSGMMGKVASTLRGMVPMIGSFIGPAIEGVTKLFGKIFGKSEESSKVSPLRDEFFKLQGGLETLNPRVQELTGNLTLVQAVFNAKTVEQYNAAIANLNGLFEQEQDAIAALTETAAKYGLTLEELGPAMQRQQLDKQAQQLYKDWQVLNAAGIQTTVITARMAEAINKYTRDAVSMGVEVPEAMRPMLEQMVEMGQLTDASGNKIDNLENSGISFAMTMSAGFKALITEVQKLTDLLGRSLGQAVESTTDKIKRIPSKVPVEIRYTESGAVPQEGTGKIPGYATGTGGFVDFGAGTLAMLHGREAVVPESALAHGGALGGPSLGGAVNVTINAQGAFFDTPGDLQRLATKVNDALTAKYGLSNRNRAA